MSVDPRHLGLVALGGAIGASLRYLVSVMLAKGVLPWGTLSVNVLGSFLLGFLVFHDLAKGDLGPGIVALVGIGALGAFTTMSTVGVDTVTYWAEGHVARGLTSALVNLTGSVFAAYLGRLVALWTSGPMSA